MAVRKFQAELETYLQAPEANQNIKDFAEYVADSVQQLVNSTPDPSIFFQIKVVDLKLRPTAKDSLIMAGYETLQHVADNWERIRKQKISDVGYKTVKDLKDIFSRYGYNPDMQK